MKHHKQQNRLNTKSAGLLPIGIVSAMIGYVAIKGTDGFEKLLKAGEKLFSNDEIITGEDGHAVIELVDGSKIEVGSDSNVVLDDDVIDAKLLQSLLGVAPAGGEQNAGGFDVTRVDIQEQLDSTVGNQGDNNNGSGTDSAMYVLGETDVVPENILPDDADITLAPTPDMPDTPDNPVGKTPTISIADVVVIEPAPSGSQGQQGGQGGSDTHGSGEEDSGAEGHDAGGDTGEEGHGGSGSSGEGEEGHDTGSDTGEEGHGGDEGEGGHETYTPTYAIFTVTLSAPALTTVTVDYTTANGTAIVGGHGANENDYGQTQGTLTILPGETSATIQIEIMGDHGVESDNEYFYVNLSNAHGANIADGQAIAHIIDSGHGEGDTGEAGVLIGTDGDDVLIAGGGRDTIYGGDGDDTLNGRGGPDALFGDDGDDTMLGLGGPDTLSGGAGNDVMYGHGGPDVMDGGSGNDSLDGGGAPDTLIGGDGNDILVGGGGPDLMQGDAGEDLLYGDGGPDTMQGGTGNDTIYGGGGGDLIEGGPGNDTLYGEGGPDIIDGGLGSDILVGGGAGDVFRFDNFDGIDSIIDFKPQQGDVIDISALLEDFNVNDPVSNYVQLTQTAEPDTFELMVNPTGSSIDDFQLLVTLENFQHSASIDDLVDNGNLILSDLV